MTHRKLSSPHWLVPHRSSSSVAHCLLVDIGCSHIKRTTTIKMPYLETRIKALRRTRDYSHYLCVEMCPSPVEKLRTTERQYCYTLQGPPRQMLPPVEVASGTPSDHLPPCPGRQYITPPRVTIARLRAMKSHWARLPVALESKPEYLSVRPITTSCLQTNNCASRRWQ